MKTSYDGRDDALSLRFSEDAIAESEELRPGIVLDYDAQGRIVAITIHDASTRLSGEIAKARSTAICETGHEAAANTRIEKQTGPKTAPAPGIAPELDAMLEHLSAKYCWDSAPDRAMAEADRVILRTFDVGTWEDTLELERVVGHATLRATLSRTSAGALTPRAWSFWHYRLGLVDVDSPPPPRPARMPR